MRWSHYSLLASVFLMPVSGLLAEDSMVEAKDVAASPADILSGRVRLPADSARETASWTALRRYVDLDQSDLSFRPGDGKALVAILADDPEEWGLRVQSFPDAGTTSGELHTVEALVPGALSRVVTIEPGTADVSVTIDPSDSERPAWVLLADGVDDLVLRTRLDVHGVLVDDPVALVARVEGGALVDGVVRFRSPDGIEHQVPLSTAGPSVQATFVPEQVGDWTVHTIARVLDGRGIERHRTTQQIMRVMRPELTLAGVVSVEQQDDGRISLDIPVNLLAQDELGGPRRAAVACEIWGSDSTGESVPVCWVARMHELPSIGGPSSCSLRFDPRWLAMADVDPSTIELRELRVHSSEGFGLLSHDPFPSHAIRGGIKRPTVTPGLQAGDLHAGHSGQVVTGMPGSTEALRSNAGHVLLLSHGYCTDQFPWRTSNFSGDIELYEDYGQNLSHDTFALRFEARGRNFKSMGIAGHSQGGHAAAHLYTFYWSALDWPSGSRRIQGVGVPWLGTALAGNAAVLGEVFGIGCGTNYDLTYEGCAAWISFIPTWVREDVWYWTTSFTDGWFYDYCQIVTDVLLSDPDDGTVERYAGQLEGANNGGHKTGWCHTRLMRDPPQCKDADRNVELNAEAAR